MKKTFLTALALGVLGLASANAVPITGSITFGGTVSLSGGTGSAGNATGVSGWHFAGNAGTPYVSGASGDFLPTLGGPAIFFAPWSFNSGAIASFWTAGAFTFNLIQSDITFQGIDGGTGLGSVTVNGTGTVTAPGKDATFGTWSFSTQDPSDGGTPPVFSFSASSSAAAGVPEGGATVGLLGLALGGIEIVRRKLNARRA